MRVITKVRGITKEQKLSGPNGVGPSGVGPSGVGPLTQVRIVDACIALLERDGAEGLSLRRVGAALGVDATAIYRHFRDKDDLLRAVGDRLHESVLVDLPRRGSWRAIVRTVCIRLRASHLQRPDLALFVRTGPPLHENEFALTEVLLTQLGRAGLVSRDAALGYHALIELTVASASIDADMAGKGELERKRLYGEWRHVYAKLDPSHYPTSVAHASQLYRSSADARFEFALDRLLDGLVEYAADK